MENICSFCGQKVKIIDKVGRRDVCDSCGNDLHCCLQCRFHDKNAYNECLEPQAERVLDKEKANFCDYFEFQGKAPQADNKDDHLTKLDKLFKK